MKDALARQPLKPGLGAALVLLLVFSAAPHAAHLSPWVTGFFLALAAIRLLASYRPRAMPGRWLLLLLTLAGVANVVLHHGGVGRDGGIALLVSMLGLKLLELRSRRDVFVAVFLGYFVVATQFLYAQTPLLATYLAVLVLGLTLILVELNRAGAARAKTSLRMTLSLFGQALPVAVVLFVLFPRLGSPLFGLGLDSAAAVTGLSDRITPGSISQLSQSDELAFRVEFDGTLPPPAQRYWRGPVLWDSDGTSWQVGAKLTTAPQPIETLGPAIDYRVTLEPSGQHWLLALDLPLTTPENARMGADFTLRAADPIRKRHSYSVRSVTTYRSVMLPPEQRQRALALAHGMAPRARALAQRWREEGDAADVVAAALRLFREEPFVYTLNPPRYDSGDAVDDFLFQGRKGFCGHYATAFVTLMRAAAIPARIVAGYQGGEINPHGGHLMVRQSDAHAWAEVWLADKGWVRIDPTAAVAPERVERAIRTDVRGRGAPVVFELGDSGFARNLMRRAGWLLDALDLGWHRWVVGFSRDRQRSLLSRLGLGFLDDYALALAAIAGAAIAMSLGWWLLGTYAPAGDPLHIAYQRFCRKLARRGVPRESWEGPLAYGERAAESLPKQALLIRRITALYVALRYGREPKRSQLQRLRSMVRELG